MTLPHRPVIPAALIPYQPALPSLAVAALGFLAARGRRVACAGLRLMRR